MTPKFQPGDILRTIPPKKGGWDLEDRVKVLKIVDRDYVIEIVKGFIPALDTNQIQTWAMESAERVWELHLRPGRAEVHEIIGYDS
jgi:hypothetical protein